MLIRDPLTEWRLWQLPNMAATIDRDSLKAKMDRGESFRLIEVSRPEEYTRQHLPGAVNIPLHEIRQRALQEFSKYDHIVVYSSGRDVGAAISAARILQELGFVNVYLYEGGKEDWVAAGYPAEGVEKEATAGSEEGS